MKQLPDIHPVHPTRAERLAAGITDGARRVPGLRRVLLWPVVSRPGYWFATACSYTWGALLGGRFETRNGMHVLRGLPTWAFGRGGTTIGAIYLTRENVSDNILVHEAEHREQWKRYGFAFILLYVAAGSVATTNRFEVGAGLELGGYVH